jgi:LysM repeat protein
MSYIKHVLVIALAALLISSCQMSYPGADATPVPTKPFTKPLATDPMQDLQNKATSTALAKTAIAGGGPTSTPTPQDVPGVVPSSTNTPLGGAGVVPSNTPAFGGSGGGTGPTPTLKPVTGRPPQYVLREGEFPYCIARRYDVNPNDLLQLSGLSDGILYPAGTVLHIPQSGSFPGDRALRQHPTTYTVTSSNETFYSIACLFGDVYPENIAQASGIALGTPLTVGQPIKIP